MFYEIRHYRVLPGKMEEWLKLMEGEFIPFAESKGMNITGTFRGEEDETVYYWIRRFESEAERERIDAAVYESDTLKNDIGPRSQEVLYAEGHVIHRVVPTSSSAAQ